LIKEEQGKQFAAQIEESKLRLENSKLNLREAVDFVVQNGDLPDVTRLPGTEGSDGEFHPGDYASYGRVLADDHSVAQIAKSESSTISSPPQEVPVGRHEQNPWSPLSRNDRSAGGHESNGSVGNYDEVLGPWVSVRAEESVLDLGPDLGPPLYHRDIHGAMFEGDEMTDLFPDFDEAEEHLEDYPDYEEGAVEHRHNQWNSQPQDDNDHEDYEEEAVGDAEEAPPIGVWVPVKEEDRVLDRPPRGRALYHRDDDYDDDAEGDVMNPVFPDPNTGLEHYLDTSKEQVAVLLKRQFDEWWAKIQANKSLINQHEFNKQITLAEIKYGHKFSSHEPE